jgi:hypothetical protein
MPGGQGAQTVPIWIFGEARTVISDHTLQPPILVHHGDVAASAAMLDRVGEYFCDRQGDVIRLAGRKAAGRQAQHSGSPDLRQGVQIEGRPI